MVTCPSTFRKEGIDVFMKKSRCEHIVVPPPPSVQKQRRVTDERPYQKRMIFGEVSFALIYYILCVMCVGGERPICCTTKIYH